MAETMISSHQLNALMVFNVEVVLDKETKKYVAYCNNRPTLRGWADSPKGAIIVLKKKTEMLLEALLETKHPEVLT